MSRILSLLSFLAILFTSVYGQPGLSSSSGLGLASSGTSQILTSSSALPNNNCLVNVCQNGALCSNISSVVSCGCTAGFSGHFCEINYSPCTNPTNPCKNSGLCSLAGANSYTCQCQFGWLGNQCTESQYDCPQGYQITIQPDGTSTCIPNQCTALSPCLNNGVCMLSPSSLGYTCDCPVGYTGSNCNQKVDVCFALPCGYHGQCSATSNSSYVCKCDSKWSGTHCDINNGTNSAGSVTAGLSIALVSVVGVLLV